MKIKSMTFAVAASTAVLSVFAADMASQPWVNMRIARQETNTQAVVDFKLSSATNAIGIRLDNLKKDVYRGISQAMDILSNTNDPHASDKAYQKIIESATPMADFLTGISVSL